MAPISAQAQLDTWLEKIIKNELRRRSSLEKEAASAKDAEKLQQWASLVMANIYRIDDSTEKIVVEDWDNGGQQVELSFDLQLGTPREQAEATFQKMKKMKRSSSVVADLLEQSFEREQQLTAWREAAAEIVDSSEDRDQLYSIQADIRKKTKKLGIKLDTLPSGYNWGRSSIASEKRKRESKQSQEVALFASQTPGWTGRQFTSPDGIPILVGRNRRENEHLTLSLARDPDVWMHVRGSPGAHVVLQISQVKGKPEPSDECLQMAADLAAFYSELRDENKVPVSIANPRYIKKPNGAPLGTVQITKEEGSIIAAPTKSILIPPEIKERRENELFGNSKPKKQR